jgi:heptosyltransferase-2
MSRILIVKLGAAGDVVRTTPILTALANYEIDWLTSSGNAPLLTGTSARVFKDPGEIEAGNTYELVISLEEDFPRLSRIFSGLRFQQVIGAYPASENRVLYTPEFDGWFDMSLISTYGPTEANRLKIINRRSYQHIIFAGLGCQFGGEEYILPSPATTSLRGDVALVDYAGGRWPNKRWGHLASLAARLSGLGTVNILPGRESVLNHLGDINNHRIIVTPDSLPMHLGIGLKKATFGIFNCTSPWEIHPYRTMTRLVSPRLSEFYYATEFIPDATLALPLDDVYNAVRQALAKLGS